MKALSRLASFLSWTPVAIVISDRIVTLHLSRNTDMHPAVPCNTLCLVRRIHPSTLTHGQVVAVTTPDGARTVLRRLVALPGDYVRPRHAAPVDAASFPATAMPSTDGGARASAVGLAAGGGTACAADAVTHREGRRRQKDESHDDDGPLNPEDGTDLLSPIIPLHNHDDSPMREHYVPPGFVWLEADTITSGPSPPECEGTVPVAVIRGRVTRLLPSLQTIAVTPSDRAFPSANKQLYIATQQTSG